MARRKRGRPVHGWAVIDKPQGMTSTQVVGRVRWRLDAQKAGHGGTLDPLATGVLPIALGEATKTVPYVMDGLKAYRFTARWGEARDTDDADGSVIATSERRPSEAEIIAALEAFTGDVFQRPPSFSAVKVDGQRAYDLAREGAPPVLEGRWVYCDSVTLTDMPDRDHAAFALDCGKGFYVRSLVRDLAERLGTCGHVESLRRTRVGPFGEEMAIALDNWLELSNSPDPTGRLLPVETALDDIPALAVSGPDAARLMRGQAILVRGQPVWVRGPDGPQPEDPADATVLCSLKGRPIALCEYKGMELRPMRVFNLT